GFNVSVYDINDEVLEKAKAKFQLMCKAFRKDLKVTQEQLDMAFDNLSYTSDLAEAVKDADLMIEAIPEIPDIKIEFYEMTVISVTTNSSTIPSVTCT
ncbi:3-hydroxyacyl-CoA dehydrogenase NAD-binding domain-containing protein, partial [Psychrobacter sp. APC 3350]